MTDSIDAIFQTLQNRFGVHPSGIATIALFAVVVVIILALVIYARLKRAHSVMAELAERLGYEPPYENWEELLDEEPAGDAAQRDKLAKLEQLEIRVGELEAEGKHKDANFEALQKHSQDLDEQLRQATLQNDALTAQTSEQVKMNRAVVEQLEKGVRDMEAEHSSNLSTLQARTKELEEQLQQAFQRNDKVMALANDQAQANQKAVEQFDQQLRDVEAENSAKLAALQRRSKELEEQLRQTLGERDGMMSEANEQIKVYREAAAQLEQRLHQMEEEGHKNLDAQKERGMQMEDELHRALREKDELMAQAGEQSRDHSTTVGQLEDRIRQLESEGKANLPPLQMRVRELEEQLQQVYLQRDQVMAQASEQAQAHRETLTQIEQRIREIEAQGNANLLALEQRSRDLEGQLEQAAVHHERMTNQASDQVRAHGETVALLEDRIRQIEMERNEHLGGLQHHAHELEEKLREVLQNRDAIAAQTGELMRAHGETVAQLEERIHRAESGRNEDAGALQQRAQELEEQLRQSNHHRESIAAQAGEMVQAHGETVAQLEGRIRELEVGGNEQLTAAEQRAKDLEEQLERANIRNERATAQAAEQVQAYRSSVDKLEQRIRELESEGSSTVSALQQRARELEEQLEQAHSHHEGESTGALKETEDRTASMELLSQQVRDLEGQRDEKELQVQSLHGRLQDLELELHQATNRLVSEPAGGHMADSSAKTAEQLMRKAEWITAHSVGMVLPHGLVAAEVYASAALAANPKRSDAVQLLAELARIRRAFPDGFPTVQEAVTTFDSRAAAFIAADPAQAAEIAEDEARRRSRAGLNRSALLTTNMALELREKSDVPDSPTTMQLQELKAALVERIG